MGVKLRKWKDGWYLVVHENRRRRAWKVVSREAGETLLPTARAAFAIGGLAEVERALRTSGGDGLTFEEYSRRWLAQMAPTWAANTRERNEGVLRVHAWPAFGSRRLEEVSYADLKSLVVALVKKRSRDTARLTVAAVRQCLDEAVNDGLIPSNPARAKLSRFWRALETKDPEPFTGAELERILKRLRHPADRFVVRLLASTGMRVGEASGLRWDEIDWERGRAHVRRSRDPRGRLKGTKTGRSRRVEVDPGLLSEERARQREWLLGKGAPDLGWVCVGPRRPVFHYASFRRRWKTALKSAGVPYRPPGDLRHTYASRELGRGAPPVKVARQMGHASAATTFRYYARWIEEGGAERSEGGSV